MHPEAIERWREIAKSHDAGDLELLLAEDVVFQSPVVHTPQRGKAITMKYLGAAIRVLGGDAFRYVGEWFGETSAVLEFITTIDGLEINGVDTSGLRELAAYEAMIAVANHKLDRIGLARFFREALSG